MLPLCNRFEGILLFNNVQVYCYCRLMLNSIVDAEQQYNTKVYNIVLSVQVDQQAYEF